MKRFLVTITLLLSAVLAAQAQTIRIDAQRESLQSVLKSISAQSDYKFAFNSRSIDTSIPVSASITSDSIEEVLDAVFGGTTIGYNIMGRQIALFIKPILDPAPQRTETSRRTVSGTVTDEDGLPLEGAAVLIKGTTDGTVTNAEGRWSLTVPDAGTVLTVSYIGFEDKDIYTGDGSSFVTVMKTSWEFIQQVVVTGYQTLSRERSSGSFAMVKGSEVQTRAQTSGSALKGLEGSVAGLNVNESADGTTFLIRGMTSINSKTEPLYIVDGVPMSRDLLEKMVNPSDIENVTFLKDATAASIWGAQAANGVVVFTTRKGQAMTKPSVSYNGSFTWKGMPDYSYMDMMDAATFISTAKEVFDPTTYKWADINKTTYGTTFAYPIVLPHEAALYGFLNGDLTLEQRDARLAALQASDWRRSYEKNFMSNAFLTNHSVSLSGGGENNTYHASLEYQGSQGSSKNTENLFNANLRNVLRINDALSFDVSLGAMYSRSKSHLTASDEFSDYSTNLPYASFEDADGSPRDMSDYFFGPAQKDKVKSIDLSYFPGADFLQSTSVTSQYAVRANLGVTLDITEWLTYEGRFQYSVSSTNSQSYYPASTFQVRVERAYALGPDGKENLPSSGGHFTDGNTLNNAYTVRNQLSFNKEFGAVHSVTALAGFEFNADKTGGTSSFVRGYDYQTMQHIFYDDYVLYTTGVKNPLLPRSQSATANEFDPDSFSQTEIEYRFVSMYANAAYTLMDKYSLNASIRVDQSNLFGSDPSVQFKPIWSVGAIWNVRKEDFMRNADWIGRLNLRLSYGLAGNSPDPGQGGPYNLISSASDPMYSRFGLGYKVTTPANDKLTWEQTRTINAGVDFSAFNGRLDASLDVYDKYTTNLLTAVPVDPTTGFTSALSNIGEMSNRGFELSVSGTLLKAGDLSWNAFFNLTYNRNKLESMYITPPDTPSSLISYSYWEGYPYGTVFAYKWAGLDPADGLSRVYNENGEAVRQASLVKGADAIKYMGTTIPPWFGSLGTSVTWKGLTLSALFVYNMGHVLRNDVNTQFTHRLTGSLHNDFTRRWKNPGDELATDIPAYFPLSNTAVNETDVAGLYKYADINVLSASFLKLRDITLTYRLPEKWISAIGLGSITVGAQVSNLFYLAANGQGIDPEAFSLSYGSRADRFRPFVTGSVNIEF